jgi:SOUL heme-binding protein
VEVRQYDPYLIAEVTFKKSEAQDMKAALSGGFRAIAGYIFDSKVGSRGATCHVQRPTSDAWPVHGLINGRLFDLGSDLHLHRQHAQQCNLLGCISGRGAARGGQGEDCNDQPRDSRDGR